jgi:hypothetical protein
MARAKPKLSCGVGINDADYVVQPQLFKGKQQPCRYYARWWNLINRCYSEKELAKYPTYRDCYVCEDWLTFSKFKAWMELQDFEGKHLDKDIIIKGNRIYSPEACAFVDPITNGFVADSSAARGDFPIGVNWNDASKRFVARCQNPFTRKRDYLGSFTCPNLAHEAWRKRKHELACQLADLQTDTRVALGLRTRYL